MADDRPLETPEEAINRLSTRQADFETTVLARLSRRPVGAIDVVFRPNPQPGTLFMRGQTLQRADYPALWAWAQEVGAVVAGGYGAGNGSTTFTLPDLRDRFVMGAGGAVVLGGTGGAATRTLTTANLPPHDHNVSGSGSTGSAGNHSHSGSTGNGGSHGGHSPMGSTAGGQFPAPDAQVYSDGNHTHGLDINDAGSHSHSVSLDINESSVGSGTGFDNRPPYLAINVAVWT